MQSTAVTVRRMYTERVQGRVHIQMVLVPPSPDVEWDIESLPKNPNLHAKLERTLEELGVRRAFVLMTAAMNNLIVHPSHFGFIDRVDGRLAVCHNDAEPAHGIFLERVNDAMVIATTGDTCLMAYGEGKCVAIQEATTIQEGVDNIPVISTVSEELESRAANIRRMSLCGFFGLAQKKALTKTCADSNFFGNFGFEKVIGFQPTTSKHLIIAHRLS